jgi:hypothetical protein
MNDDGNQKIWGMTYWPDGTNPYTGAEPKNPREYIRSTHAETSKPLKMQWCCGSALIGDFTHVGGWVAIVAKISVAVRLQSKFSNLGIQNVELVKARHLISPKNGTIGLEPRVWWPYTGEEIYELFSTTVVVIDLTRTTAPKGESADRRETVYVSGCGVLDIIPFQDAVREVPRKQNHGIYVTKNQFADFFHLKSPNGNGVKCCGGEHEIGPNYAMYCSNRAKKYIEKNKFTNIVFVEVGEFF